MNLTAVRDVDVLVRLHLGECLRAAQSIPADVETVLDFGSGAGFRNSNADCSTGIAGHAGGVAKKKAAFLRGGCGNWA